MELHRTTGRPDWEDVVVERRSRLQRLAAASHGYVTPGNVATMLGFGLVIAALVYIAHGQYWIGVVLLVVGRLMDIVDGWVANATDTKSPLGESLDAGFDKLGTVLTVIVFLISHIAAWGLLAALVIPHIFIAVYSAPYVLRGQQLHPSRAGKLSMAAAWLSLVGLVVLRAEANDFLAWLVYGLVVASCAMGLFAAYGYVRHKA